MKLMGLLLVIAGWIISIAAILISQSNGVRLGLVSLGIAVSIFGILGVLNPAYLKHAVWKS
ncbi:MAG: hypothetical protein ACXVZX_14110 [Terriglobales bacterium]